MPCWLCACSYSSEAVVKLMVGNKCDLTDMRSVPTEEAKTFAEQ